MVLLGIADEATDVASNEQMSVAIRWVDNNYYVRPWACLVRVPKTTAETSSSSRIF